MALSSLKEEIQKELQFTNEQFQEILYQIQKIEGFNIIIPQMLRNIMERVQNYINKYSQQNHISFSDLHRTKEKYIKDNNYFINELNDIKMLCKSLQMNYNSDQLTPELAFLIQQLQSLIEGISAVNDLYYQIGMPVNNIYQAQNVDSLGYHPSGVSNENFLVANQYRNQLQKPNNNAFVPNNHELDEKNDQQQEASNQSSEISAHFSNVYQSKKRMNNDKNDINQQNKTNQDKSAKTHENLIDSTQYALVSGPNGPSGKNKNKPEEDLAYVLGSEVNDAYVKTTGAIMGRGSLDTVLTEVKQRFTELSNFFRNELALVQDQQRKANVTVEHIEKKYQELEQKCARQENIITDLKRQLEAVTGQYSELADRIADQSEFVKKILKKQVATELDAEQEKE